MKKKVLFFICITFLFTCNKLVADDTIQFDTANYMLKIISFEDTIVNGTTDLTLVVKFNDTTNYRPDFSLYIQDSIFEYIPPYTQVDTGLVTYYPGDSLIVNFGFSYDTTALPYYPVSIVE